MKIELLTRMEPFGKLLLVLGDNTQGRVYSFQKLAIFQIGSETLTSLHRHSVPVILLMRIFTLLPQKVADMLCYAISKAG